MGLFAVAAVVELAAEPAYIFCQAHLLVGSRVLLEGIAQIVRTLVTVALVLLAPDLGLLIFGATQLLAAAVLVLAYYGLSQLIPVLVLVFAVFRGRPIPRLFAGNVQRYVSHGDSGYHIASAGDLAPHRPWGTPETPEVLARAGSFVKNSFVKQLLTEGERYIMTVFNVVDFAEQGVFDVVANLGSLVARFLFLPIEENYYVFFSMLLGPGVALKHVERNMNLAARGLAILLKFGALVGLTFVAFGPAYTAILLDIYGGRNLSAGIGPYLLAWYCVYVLTMALNGIGVFV